MTGHVAYLDCSTGVAGDMLLASLIDAGLPLSDLEGLLGALGLAGHVALAVTRVQRGPFQAASLEVTLARGAPRWTLAGLETSLRTADLPPAVRRRSVSDLTRLLAVEARLHGVASELHELGSLDTVVDVVGFHYACARLGIDAVVTSPVNVGGGQVTFAHGTFGVPAPATAELLTSVPIHGDVATTGELTTPTGALLVSGEGVTHDRLPRMRIERIGYGAGRRDTPRASVVRCFLGVREEAADSPRERVLLLETNVDDMDPQLYEPLTERLFAAGALDVSLAAVIGKRGRPATVVTVIARPEQANDLTEALFEESTTLGIRIMEVERVALERRVVRVTTSIGPVDVKIARLPSGRERRRAEHRDVVARAREHGMAVVDAARLIAAEIEAGAGG